LIGIGTLISRTFGAKSFAVMKANRKEGIKKTGKNKCFLNEIGMKVQKRVEVFKLKSLGQLSMTNWEASHEKKAFHSKNKRLGGGIVGLLEG